MKNRAGREVFVFKVVKSNINLVLHWLGMQIQLGYIKTLVDKIILGSAENVTCSDIYTCTSIKICSNVSIHLGNV